GGAEVSAIPITDVPVLNAAQFVTNSPSLTLPSGVVTCLVTGYVQDRNGRQSTPQTISVVITPDAAGLPNQPGNLVQNALYGSLTVGGQPAPPEYNRFANSS